MTCRRACIQQGQATSIRNTFPQLRVASTAPDEVDCQRPDVVCYELDSDDRIVWVNQGWTTFAQENEGHALVHENVIDQSLWGFLTDSETRYLYQLMLARVRTGQAIHVRLRCDAPSYRRMIELHITAPTAGRVRLTSVVSADEQRPAVRLLQARDDRREELLLMCSWCSKIQLPDDVWVEVEEAIEQLQLFAAPRLPKLTHGICETCYQQVLHDLGEQKRASHHDVSSEL